ncbi:hypothetical protein [Burkholderia stagnalis]|uniref:hypothetical protein n=1 Tax=Burkholderia stagnalis TaxID=1503054 RepID=UPI000F81215C|nr:hypothetical protein [Burkholderia stagnalis]
MDICSSFEQATRIIESLLHITSIDCREDLGGYVSAIESIVFELMARDVGSDLRPLARAAYRSGLSVGVYGSDLPVDHVDFVCLESEVKRKSGALLEAIGRAGEAHGLMIRQRFS